VGRKHGGNIYQAARHLGVKPEKLIDFSASINPLGYAPRAKKVLASPQTAVLNYPDPEAHDFIKALAAYHNLPADHFVPGNGSSEFIHLIPYLLRPKSVLIVAPAFTEYENTYQRAKGVVFFFTTTDKDGFAIQEKALFDELRRGYSAIYICNPGCPTGVLHSPKMLRELTSVAAKKGTAVILDETFIDFAENNSLKAETAHFDNLMILRSMTKFFALPGLRAGYAITHPKNVEKLQEKLPPWSMNALAQRAAAASLLDVTHIQKSLQFVQENRDVLAADLRSLRLTVFKSCTNFLLVRLAEAAPLTATQLAEKLLARGILIRSCEDFQGLSDRYFRVAVKKKNENKKLCAELKKLLSK
jgi:threonine-phosphate decarboxylase